MNRAPYLLSALCLAGVLPALAQGNAPKPYAPTPEERQQLDEKKAALSARVKGDRYGAPDAAVFLHTAEMADRLALYTNKGQVSTVLRGLDIGLARVEQVVKGQKPWATQPGRSLRGFVSRVDGSVQPYGVTLPAGFDPAKTYPLHVVLHGRGPTEVTFLNQMEPARPPKAPEQPYIELEPFGRANNGWRWSGEADVFEALDAVTSQYQIDKNRIVLRGFSMGGHGSWHIGVHHPTRWSAVSPGAGFSDTRKYQKIPEGGVPAYQETAWRIYDAVDYALNVFNTPFIGYGGEKDPQLQATLNMKEAAAREGLDLKVVIGPGVEHKYHPDSLAEIMRFVQAPTRDPWPKEIRFTTWTLKYNECAWVTVDALQEHYRRATVRGKIDASTAKLTTENITALKLNVPPGVTALELDGYKQGVREETHPRFVKRGGKWSAAGSGPNPAPLAKRHKLQGPIDDAFTDRFLVVRPTGEAWSASTHAFAEERLKRFHDDWREGFRGEVPVKSDREVSNADWKDANLVLFGDPGSNALLAKVAAKLPIKWTRAGIEANGKKYGPEAVPVLIYPNPLNPARYVVINSGHTFGAKEIAASNAQLFPRLPDWAILKPGGGAPEVLAADYFNEEWRFK